MTNDFKIRQATLLEINPLADFIDQAAYVHRHLDWRPILDRILEKPFLVSESESGTLATLSCPPDPEYVAWIRCFACAKSASLETQWSSLINAARSFPELTACTLCAVGFFDWFIKLLEISGFTKIQNIVVLKWNHEIPDPLRMDKQILIRPMKESDLDAVTQVDKLAFQPIWRTSRGSLGYAFAQSTQASIAEINDQVIGYELSTGNHLSGHLARLAVHPDYIRENIGYNLCIQLLKDFSLRGIKQITVNTQDDNIASLGLYHKLGFHKTGDTFPVHILEN